MGSKVSVGFGFIILRKKPPGVRSPDGQIIEISHYSSVNGGARMLIVIS